MDLEKEIVDFEIALAHAQNANDEYYIVYYSNMLRALKVLKNNTYGPDKTEYPQTPEPNEYHHIDPHWLDDIAIGLTAGAAKYPGKTWKAIPAERHAARAFRHLNEFNKGDRRDNHLINAAMRCMMAYVVDREAKMK